MKRGQAYFAQGDFAKAGVEYRNAMQIMPKDRTVRLAAATVAERMGHPRDALALYQSVLDVDPHNLEAGRSVARLLLFGGLTDPAMKLINAGLGDHPDDAGLLSLRAAAEVRSDDLDAATRDADHALQLAPGSVDAVQVRAGIYRQRNDLPGTTALLRAAIEKSPSSAELREILVDVYMRTAESAKAEEQLNTLIRLAPQELRYSYQLAILYSREHRLDDAQRTLQNVVAAHPRSTEPRLILVDFVRRQRSAAEGEKLLRGFVAQDPANYELRLRLGELLQSTKRPAEAIALYQDIVKQDTKGPNALVARNRLADIALAEGHVEQTRALNAEILQKNPRDNAALLRRAQMELGSRDATDAIVDLRALLRDQPQAVGIRKLLAQAYVNDGQPELAEEALRAALEVAPGDVSVRINLARLLVGSQKSDEAVEILVEASRRAPNDATVRIALARAYLARRDFTAARLAAQDLQVLQPDSATGPYLAGLANEGLGQLEEAQRQFEQALRIEPRAIEPLSALARLQAGRGQSAQAVALVSDTAKRDATNPAPLNLLGELLLQQRQPQAALAPLNSAIALAPRWYLPYRNRAVARLATNEVDASIADFQTALRLEPASGVAQDLAGVYEAHGRADDAILLYRSLYKSNPHAKDIAGKLAMLLITHKDDRASLDQARDLTSGFETSDRSSLLDTSGWVHFKRAEYAQALAVLQKAADREPGASQIRYHLGMAELRMGQTARARSDLEAALAGAGTFAGADEARSALAVINPQRS